jgi:hypothetical protein
MLPGARAAVYVGRSRHPLYPSIEKKNRPEISASKQGRLDGFEDAVAFEPTSDGRDGAQHDEKGPPIPSHQIKQPTLWVHLRARGKSPSEAGSVMLHGPTAGPGAELEPTGPLPAASTPPRPEGAVLERAVT